MVRLAFYIGDEIDIWMNGEWDLEIVTYAIIKYALSSLLRWSRTPGEMNCPSPGRSEGMTRQNKVLLM